METHLTISEVAKRSGLSAHTLRYYERAGLIAPVLRAPGGQRRYAAADMEWIGFLLRLRATRMPIGQMQVFARLRGEGNATASERRQMLETHLAEVFASIKAMQQSAKVLQAKIEHYRSIDRSPSQDSNPNEGVKYASKPLRTRPRQTARDRR